VATVEVTTEGTVGAAATGAKKNQNFQSRKNDLFQTHDSLIASENINV
jgi:hypothetical protein